MQHSQRGMSTYTMIVFVLMLGFSGLFSFKVGMAVLDNWTVIEVLESLAKDNNARNMSSKQIRDFIEKKFEVNRIEHISVKDDVEIKTVKGGRQITADYEARMPFFANIDLVVKFESNSVMIPGGSGF
ncbi:MAG TPA: DUF4845 domain-containing protein [Pseudomonadales bacterium]